MVRAAKREEETKMTFLCKKNSKVFLKIVNSQKIISKKICFPDLNENLHVSDDEKSAFIEEILFFLYFLLKMIGILFNW